MKLKDIVANGKKVKFLRYQKNQLWYVSDCGFEFPVPISDTGEASFSNEDKALFFMRWIRKHIENINEGKQIQS